MLSWALNSYKVCLLLVSYAMGLLLGAGICLAWGWTLFVGLSFPIASGTWSIGAWAQIGLLVWVRAFLHTGLFIIAHDAMHGSLSPRYPRVNSMVGRLMLGLYAFLSYDKSCANHSKHHRYPAEEQDPDFCGATSTSEPFQIWVWYFKFLSEYFSLKQFLLLLGSWMLLFSAAYVVWQVAVENIVLFWILPLVLSSMQLFYFGTYLPHRNPYDRDGNFNSARSLDYPIVISFLTCYHFGYHAEHHNFPEHPWYQLPVIHAQQQNTFDLS